MARGGVMVDMVQEAGPDGVVRVGVHGLVLGILVTVGLARVPLVMLGRSLSLAYIAQAPVMRKGDGL